MKQIEWHEVVVDAASDLVAARAKLASGEYSRNVAFDVGIAKLREDPARLVVELWATLTNAQSHAQSVIVATPFLTIMQTDPRVRYAGPPMPPPAPLPPSIVSLPAETAVRVGTTFDLTNWAWPKEPAPVDASLKWCASFVDGPLLFGAFRVTLPTRK